MSTIETIMTGDGDFTIDTLEDAVQELIEHFRFVEKAAAAAGKRLILDVDGAGYLAIRLE